MSGFNINKRVVIVLYILISIIYVFLIFSYKNHENNIEQSFIFQKVIFLIISLIAFYLILFTKRKKTVKETKKVDKFEQFVNNLKDDCFYYRHSLDKNFEFVSPSVKNQLGVDSDTFQTDYEKYNTHELINNVIDKHINLHKSGIIQPTYETILYDYSGKILNFQIREFPILENNKVVGVEAIAHNITEFKKIESELREKENKYHILFESANDAILIMKGGVFIDCNKKALEMFKCTYEQIIMQSPLKFSPLKQIDGRASKEKAEEKIKAALSGEPQTFQWTHNRLDGNLFEAEVSLNAFQFIEQNFIQAIVRDIDKRVKNEKNLIESEEKFRTISENTQSGIFIVQKDKYVFVNNSMQKITGYSIDELLSLNFWEIIHPDFQEIVIERGTARQRGEEVINRYEFKVLKSDGSSIWVDYNANTITYNQAPAIIGTFIDISERKKMELEISNTSKMLINSINALPDMLTVIDRNFKVIVSNWKDHDYIDDKYKKGNPFCYECYFNRNSPCENCGAEIVFKTKKPHEYEAYNKVDGILREVKVLPIFDEKGEVEMVVEYIRNISKIKKLQEKNDELVSIIDKIEINNDIKFFNYNLTFKKFEFISNSLIEMFEIESVESLDFDFFSNIIKATDLELSKNYINSLLNLEQTYIEFKIEINDKIHNVKLYSIISENTVKSIVGLFN